MGTGIESDLPVSRQGLIGEHFHSIEIAKRGHRTGFAIGEPASEFVLRGQLHNLGFGRRLQKFQIHVLGGRHHGHRQGIVDFDNDSFGDLLPRDVRERSDRPAVYATE